MVDTEDDRVDPPLLYYWTKIIPGSISLYRHLYLRLHLPVVPGPRPLSKPLQQLQPLPLSGPMKDHGSPSVSSSSSSSPPVLAPESKSSSSKQNSSSSVKVQERIPIPIPTSQSFGSTPAAIGTFSIPCTSSSS